MIGQDALVYVYAAYGVAGVALAGVALHSWRVWRKCRDDYRRLFERSKDA